jgi:hypothetical protein
MDPHKKALVASKSSVELSNRRFGEGAAPCLAWRARERSHTARCSTSFRNLSASPILRRGELPPQRGVSGTRLSEHGHRMGERPRLSTPLIPPCYFYIFPSVYAAGNDRRPMMKPHWLWKRRWGGKRRSRSVAAMGARLTPAIMTQLPWSRRTEVGHQDLTLQHQGEQSKLGGVDERGQGDHPPPSSQGSVCQRGARVKSTGGGRGEGACKDGGTRLLGRRQK